MHRRDASAYPRDDILGIGLDQDRKLLTFYKNGQLVPMMKKKNDYRIPNDHYTLLPAVCMYSARNKQQVSAAVAIRKAWGTRIFNFGGYWSPVTPLPPKGTCSKAGVPSPPSGDSLVSFPLFSTAPDCPPSVL